MPPGSIHGRIESSPRDCPQAGIGLCGPVVAGHHHRILVVEDDIELRDALGQLLEAEGYLVEFALDGSEALDRLEGGRIRALRPRVYADRDETEEEEAARTSPALVEGLERTWRPRTNERWG